MKIRFICNYRSLKLFFSLALITSFSISGLAQVKEATQNLKEQAEKMGAALISEDYKTFVIYTNPLVVRSLGGSSKMIEILEKTAEDLKANGMSFSSISFDEPSKIVKSGKELQATIAQHTEMKLEQGRLVITSTLIAISINSGVNWTFIDTSNKDSATLRKAFPNLSKEIVIPPHQKPVRYNE